MTFYLLGDTHFYHHNILKFKRQDGTPLRDFDSIDQMHECIIDNWNSVVKPHDKVYHMGDVLFCHKRDIREKLKIVDKLNGSKRLILGNHDTHIDVKIFRDHFKKVYGVKQIARVILSHCPTHLDPLDRWIGNIHGHFHHNPAPTDLHFNASCEAVDYKPVAFDELLEMFKNRPVTDLKINVRVPPKDVYQSPKKLEHIIRSSADERMADTLAKRYEDELSK